MSERFHAFTTSYLTRTKRLKSKVKILSKGKILETVALWDTGASGSCISKEVADTLGLVKTGRRGIVTPSGRAKVNTYMIDIVLPNNLVINNVVVMDSAIGTQEIGMLIGMDIIEMGDFAVSNHNGKTTISFVVPSLQKIDFVPEAKNKNME